MIRRALALLCLSLLWLAAPSTLEAATAELVRDIQDLQPPSPYDVGGGIYGPLQSIGDRILFAAGDSTSNLELWTSDGRTEGTFLVRDICPGPGCGSTPWLIGRAGRVGIFLAQSDPSGHRPTELWRSDGTPEGTFRLVDSEDLELCYPGNILTVGGAVFFALNRYDTGCELWKSDGTVAGTGMVKDIAPDSGSSHPSDFVLFGGKLHFFATGPQGNAGLWRTDGTAAGTQLLRSFSDDLFYPAGLTVAGLQLFFVASDGSRPHLWKSDGTSTGTKPVFPLSGSTDALLPLDGAVYFLVADPEDGTELWRSDGTSAGTRPVTDFEYREPFGFDNSLPSFIAKVGGRLILVANGDGRGFRLWVSSGSPETTRLLDGCTNGCPVVTDFNLTQAGDRVLFWGISPERGAELWSTDGTGTGTKLLRDICRGDCYSGPHQLIPALGKWLFLARDEGSFGVWATDGTAAGTTLLASLGPSPYDYFDTFAPFEAGGKVFFAGPVRGRRSQLWESDGTPGGTRPVTLFGSDNPGSSPDELTASGDLLMFTACDGQDRGVWRSNGTEEGTVVLSIASLSCGSSDPPRYLTPALGLTFFLRGDSGRSRLWRTDGTDGGTFPLPPFGSIAGWIPTQFGNRVVFRAFYEDGRIALWESDGTVAGTRELFELPSGARNLTVAGSDLYFIANIGSSTGEEQLWRSDGTLAGTRQVTQFESFYPFEDRVELVRVGGKVFFPATATSYSRELMMTDGTWEGTSSVRTSSGEAIVGAANLVEFGGALYFFGTLANVSEGPGLWRTDGTPAGTVLLRSVSPPYGYEPGPAWFTKVGGLLYFVAHDPEHGLELWRTDGTVAGTVLVRDIAPGVTPSNPSDLVAAGGKLYFTAYDGIHGYELWQSDGTAAGTRMVQDIAPGGSSSKPEQLTVVGDRLYFRADDGLHGQELWAYPLIGAPACQPSAEVLCLGGGRFRVEATWRDFQGNSGVGQAVALTADTGYFWFFNSANVEVILKVLDGQGVNGHHWAFYGALSNVEYTLTITDTQNGAVRRYVNPPGRLGSVGDTSAFGPNGATGSGLSFGPEALMYKPITALSQISAAAVEPCVASATRLCLNGGRFAVEARWRDFQGNTGTGKAVPLSGGDTGYFWFFNAANVEVVLKVLDGRGVNGKYWVFYGALSSVEYELTVTDTQTGAVKIYKNPSGRLASVADTGAF